MPVKFVEGDMFASDCDILVNTVNCVGVMGRGIALEFKNKFPKNFTQYANACRKGTIKPGLMNIFRENGLVIVNFPTKRHWRDPSRLDDVEAGLKSFVYEMSTRIDLQGCNVAMPKLGCGLGGLDWETVGPMIFEYCDGLDQNVLVFGPLPKLLDSASCALK